MNTAQEQLLVTTATHMYWARFHKWAIKNTTGSPLTKMGHEAAVRDAVRLARDCIRRYRCSFLT